MKLVRWGAMEEGLRFRGWGEGYLAPTLYEWGIRRGNHVLQAHLAEMWGKLQFYPCLWLMGFLRVGDSRVTLLLPNSGRQ